MKTAKNYLSRLPDEDSREKLRRQTNIAGTIYYLRRGVRGYSSQSCKMVDLSESGCQVARLLTEPVPDFVYFVLEGLPAKFPCAVIERTEDSMHLKFMTDLPTAVVDRITQKKFSAK